MAGSARRPPTLYRCGACDGPFTSTRIRKFCSRDCKDFVRLTAQCAGGCGGFVWLGRTSKSPGVAMCKSCHRSPVRRAKCPACGCDFAPIPSRGGLTETCSRKCAQALRVRRRGTDVLAHRIRNANNCARKRARFASQFVEQVDPLLVFERDGWVCYLCSGSIDPKLSGRARWGATVDHVVALIDGGEHSYANVRAAHRSCNSAKENHRRARVAVWLAS